MAIFAVTFDPLLGRLTYQGAGATSGTATLWFTIRTDNYEDTTVTITFVATEKDIATNITISDIESSITYGETLTEPNVTSTEVTDTEEFDLLYTGTKANGESYSEASAPTEPGSYTLTATLNDASAFAGSKTFDFVIEKADLAWIAGTAENKTYDGTTAATVGTAAGLDGVVMEVQRARRAAELRHGGHRKAHRDRHPRLRAKQDRRRIRPGVDLHSQPRYRACR